MKKLLACFFDKYPIWRLMFFGMKPYVKRARRVEHVRYFNADGLPRWKVKG
jgi:hypothetical protein